MLADQAQRMRLVLELRQAGVTDWRVLSALERTPRAAFIPDHLSNLAWNDAALPLEGEQSLTKPSEAARMISALDVQDRHSVLEIGTGSGWQSAVLSRLAARVVTVERRIALAQGAQQRLARLGFDKVSVQLADGALGWPDEAPYDRIIVNAAIHTARPLLLEQLKPGGILVAPVGEGAEQSLMRVVAGEQGSSTATAMGPVRFLPIEAGLAP